jgi:hypothetical protein
VKVAPLFHPVFCAFFDFSFEEEVDSQVDAFIRSRFGGQARQERDLLGRFVVS